MKPHIYRTTWQKDGIRLGELRRKVFVVEQHVPEELEWDKFDEKAVHFACEDTATAAIVGTARLVADKATNKVIIGRLCVAKSFRHRKIATQLMDEILAYCNFQKFAILELHAQLYLKEFYAGFVAEGDTYLEAGIEHVTMVLVR